MAAGIVKIMPMSSWIGTTERGTHNDGMQRRLAGRHADRGHAAGAPLSVSEAAGSRRTAPLCVRADQLLRLSLRQRETRMTDDDVLDLITGALMIIGGVA